MKKIKKMTSLEALELFRAEQRKLRANMRKLRLAMDAAEVGREIGVKNRQEIRDFLAKI